MLHFQARKIYRSKEHSTLKIFECVDDSSERVGEGSFTCQQGEAQAPQGGLPAYQDNRAAAGRAQGLVNSLRQRASIQLDTRLVLPHATGTASSEDGCGQLWVYRLPPH